MADLEETISTPLTKLLGIKYPIILAGMNKAAGPKLAAAVTNAGGLGVIGGVGFTPRILKLSIKHLKRALTDPTAPFGVDLLLPKVGKGARKTNYDYTKGKLDKLVDIIIESKAKLFVSAVGVPPRRIVDKLHSAGILIQNMVGHPKHVKKALDAGVDIICAQGGEGGGHTGHVATSILLPKCVDLVKGYKMPLYPERDVCVIGAGGIYNGRGLVSALSLGCDAVWIGTRFVCSEEAGASLSHKEAILAAGFDSTMKSLIYTGRPLRIIENFYAKDWQENRGKEMKKLLAKGTIPYTYDVMQYMEMKKKENSDQLTMSYVKSYNEGVPKLSGMVAGCINNIKTAKEIVDDIMKEALEVIKENVKKIKIIQSKL